MEDYCCPECGCPDEPDGFYRWVDLIGRDAWFDAGSARFSPNVRRFHGNDPETIFVCPQCELCVS